MNISKTRLDQEVNLAYKDLSILWNQASQSYEVTSFLKALDMQSKKLELLLILKEQLNSEGEKNDQAVN